MTSAHHHCALVTAAESSSHFARNPPDGGNPMSDVPASAKASSGHRQRAADAAQVGDAIMPERRVDESGRQEHRGLRRRMRDGLEHAAGHRPPRCRGCAACESAHEREHQKQVPDLGDGRIRDEQLQARLPQRDHVADENGRRAERAEHLSRGPRHDTGKHVEPEPDDEEPRSLDDQCRETWRSPRPARRRARAAATGAAERARSWPATPPSSLPPPPTSRRRDERARPEARCPSCRRRRTGGRLPADTASSPAARRAGSARPSAASRRGRPGTRAARPQRSGAPARRRA